MTRSDETSKIELLPEQARQILMVHNPTAGARSGQPRVEQLRQLLEQRRMAVRRVDRAEQLREAIQQTGPAAVRAVIAAGGDGTISATVHHTPPGTPIVALPLGTENLLARYLELPRDPQAVVQLILGGLTVRLDAGEANGRCFVLMAGCGFDGEVVRRAHANRQGHIRRWSYAKPIWDTMRSYQYPELRVYCDPVAAEQGGAVSPVGDAAPWAIARWVFVINLPRYAGGLRFVPAASATDGLLDVCAFRRGSWWRGLWYLAGVISGRHLRWSDVRHCRTRALRIESAGPVPYQLDGDPGGELPLRLRLLPERVRVLVTESWATRRSPD